MAKNLFLTISIVLFSIFLKAQNAIVIDDAVGKEKLAPHLQMLDAITCKADADEIIKGKFDKNFTTFDETKVIDSKGKFWLKFSISNNTSELKKYFIGATKFDSLTFYLPDTAGKYRVSASGTLFSFKKKEIVVGPFSFAQMEVKPNATAVCYLKVENINQPIFQFASLTPTVFNEQQYQFEYGNIWIYNLIFLGICGIMLLYNFMLFVITKERAYLIYLGYILFIMLYVFALSGDAIAHIFDNAKNQNDLVLFSGIAALLFYAAFSRSVLEFEKFFPKWNKAFLVIIILLGIAALLTVFDLTMIAIPMCFVLALIVYPSIVVMAYIIAFKKKYLPARYFFIAAIAYIIFLQLSFVQMLGIFPVSLFGLHANNFTQIGVSLELTLFSIALAAKLNQMRKEKFEAQQLALAASQENEKIIKEQNILLEQKVNERTSELNNTLDDLKNTQKQLLLNEKMASLGQLMAGIAHEINNPINFVSSNIAPLKRDFADIETLYNRYKTSGIKSADPEIDRIVKELDIDYTFKEVAELLNGIEVGAKRTAEIVKGLKTFSRLDEVEKVNYDLEEGLEGTLILLSSKIAGKEIVIEKNYEQLLLVKCFAGKINQVFMNIIANGIDALDEKGKLIITTKVENDHVIISIADNGMGMNEETQAKIFDPFFTTKDVGSGTGLGLSITYGIIESHNGKIEVNSEVGKGTTFTISLPIN